MRLVGECKYLICLIQVAACWRQLRYAASCYAIIMKRDIYRFAVVAKPSKNHPKYFEWQTVDAVVFVADENGYSARDRTTVFLKQHHLRVLEYMIEDRLIEERVLADDCKETHEQYNIAKTTGITIAFQRVREFFSDKESPPLYFPELTEQFFDRIFGRIGGVRFPSQLVENQAYKTADYLVDDHVVELKFLLQDPYETNTERIAKLFQNYPTVGAIDPASMSDKDQSTYRDIIMKPLRTHVRKASKQIKGVREYLKKPEFVGGILLVNQAATALMGRTHELLIHAVRRHTSVIDTVMSIEVIQKSNGMDTSIDTLFEPARSSAPLVRRLQIAYHDEFHALMQAFAEQGFITDNPAAMNFSKPIDEAAGFFAQYDEMDNPYLT